MPVPAELRAALNDPDPTTRENANKALECWESAYHFGLDHDTDLGHKYGLMLRILEKAIGYFPKFASAHRRRGELLVAKLDDKAAVPEFTKAIRLNLRDAHAYSKRGLARWR